MIYSMISVMMGKGMQMIIVVVIVHKTATKH